MKYELSAEDMERLFESVFQSLSKLSREEFLRRLEIHKTGSIAKMILETEALSVDEEVK